MNDKPQLQIFDNERMKKMDCLLVWLPSFNKLNKISVSMTCLCIFFNNIQKEHLLLYMKNNKVGQRCSQSAMEVPSFA